MSVVSLASTWRTARKDHHGCWCCGGTIGKGDRYFDLRCAEGGRAYTLRIHRLCERLWMDAGAEEDWPWSVGQEYLIEFFHGLIAYFRPAKELTHV